MSHAVETEGGILHFVGHLNRYMLGGNKLAISTVQQTAAIWRAVTFLLSINISLHYFQVKTEFKIAVSFGKNQWTSTYLLSLFKGATILTEVFVASKMLYLVEKCSGLNHLRLSSQQTFIYVGKF